ncbi:MAG TPA: Lpp/OprI family alanine-zipper lipoprotein [Rhizomicrobium sp.]|nr:Lpp/OprI family alanine-zipper lipoprotein [Rhizomicrobium sp.]
MNFLSKATLLSMAGAALMLGGCASVDDVRRAQSTADQALSAAQHAQSTADQALSTAQSAQSAAQAAQQGVDQLRNEFNAHMVKHHGQRG